MWTAPLAAVVLAVTVPLALEVLGADCPVEGMDYLNQCNGLATASMVFLFGGLIVAQIAVVAAVYALIIRAAGAAWHKTGRAGGLPNAPQPQVGRPSAGSTVRLTGGSKELSLSGTQLRHPSAGVMSATRVRREFLPHPPSARHELVLLDR